MELNIEKAVRIYRGVDRACRCGCKGNYAERGTKLFTRYVNEMKKREAELVNPENTGDILNLEIDGTDKAFTIYYA